MTSFKDLCDLCEGLASTTKRLEKMAMIADFLKRLNEDEIAPAVLYVSGRVFPESDMRTLDIGYRTISNIEAGQMRLDAQPLSILRVRDYFERIAGTKGKSSRSKRARLLHALFEEAGPFEAKWLTRLLIGEMRHGVDEGVMLEAIGKAIGVNAEVVKRALMLKGDIGEVARIALTKGGSGLEALGVVFFTPLKPMLAEMAYSFDEILEAHRGKSAMEYKFDGARVQIHKGGNRIKIFTRRLSEVTDSLPDVVKLVADKIAAEEAVLDGEVYGVRGGRPLPFQDLMRRFKRVHEIEEMVREVPVELRLFDVLYLNGKSLLESPWSERARLLGEICEEPGLIAERRIVESTNKAEEFLRSALHTGHEGIVAKDPDSPYMPGKRGKRWFKVKQAESLDVVIVAAEWGHGRRRGWLSNYHLAVRDEQGGYAMIGKTFKGLTDEEFKEMTSRLLQLKVSEDEYTVYVKPEVVVEVAYDEIQRSPRYPSGFALRFARITRIRLDKGPHDADTLRELEKRFSEQSIYAPKKEF